MDYPSEERLSKGSIEYILNPRVPKFVLLNICFERGPDSDWGATSPREKEPEIVRGIRCDNFEMGPDSVWKETCPREKEPEIVRGIRCDKCDHVYNRVANYLRVSQKVFFLSLGTEFG